VEAAHIVWRPLGQLLVEQGMLTSSELERALAEQQKSGRRLGEIIVELGFVSGPELSNALAAQYGIELTTETGFGTGLRSEIQRRHEHSGRGTVTLEVVPDPPVEAPTAAAEAAVEPQLLPQLEEQWARLAAAESALAERERELRELREVNERLREQLRGGPAVKPVVDGHLLFVQLDGRYALISREGPPPLADAELLLPDLDEGTFVVSGRRPSPLPGDARPCVVAVRA
jgi:plasmid stabilization system protein ParE